MSNSSQDSVDSNNGSGTYKSTIKEGALLGGGAFNFKQIPKGKTIVSLPETKDIANYNGFILDMDGVLQKNGVAIPGAADFMNKLRKAECPVILLTNECRYTNQELADKLKRLLGYNSPTPEEIYSSGNSTRDFFERLIFNGYVKSTYVIGERGLMENLNKAYSHFEDMKGCVFSGLDEHDEKKSPVGYVVIGSVFQQNTRHIERAANFIRKGARLVHTCPDMYDLHADGSFCFGMPMPTVYLLENACGVSSYNLGKPNTHMLRMAQTKMILKKSVKSSEILFVGDSINTDIRTSIENGIDCVLLMQGITSRKALMRSPLKPNYVFETIEALSKMFFADSDVAMKIDKKYNFESFLH